MPGLQLRPGRGLRRARAAEPATIGGMDDKPRYGIRDPFWLLVLCLVLAAWGWDRGRLAARIDTLTAPAPVPVLRTTTILAPLGRSAPPPTAVLGTPAGLGGMLPPLRESILREPRK